MTGGTLSFDAFQSATLGLLVFLVGTLVTRRVGALREFNIPEPVTGGLIAACAFLLIELAGGPAAAFDLALRDYLLVLFFAGIGLNARLADLARGGRRLMVLIALTAALIVLQNLAAVATAPAFGLPAPAGVLLGSASLIGGHGTAIAGAPEVARATAAASAMEIGVATATLGLIVAALMGGPIARVLIARHRLQPSPSDEQPVGLAYAEEDARPITAVGMMHALFVLHVVILIGMGLHQAVRSAGLLVPLFVPCMLVAIAGSNLYPLMLPRAPRVARSPALALVTDVALGVFLAMSLMSLNLAALAGSGALVAVSLALQSLLALAFTLFLVFRLLGRDYTAAVLSAGFAGFALGATPTAIANMTAVTKRHGPAPIAFVVLPLVSAFFVDLANAVIIQGFLGVFGR
jgi:ESS family glutamate:Na+ symporter